MFEVVFVSVFFLEIVENFSTEVVVAVAFAEAKNHVLHATVKAVDVVHQALLGCFRGASTLLKNAYDVLYLAAVVGDGVVQKLPFLCNFPLLKRLAAGCQETYCCQSDNVGFTHTKSDEVKVADTLVVDDAANGLGEGIGHGELLHFRTTLGVGDGVGEDNLLER